MSLVSRTMMFGVVLLFAAACGDGDGAVGGGGSEPTADTADTTLGDGEEVTVTGTVDDVFADTVFTLTDATFEEDTVVTEGDVAVIATDGADVSESEGVVVTGTLLSVDVSNVQQLEDLFGANVDDEVLALLADQQVVIASSVGQGG